MSASNYLEEKTLNYIFGKASFTQPTIWVGLSTADPTDDGSGLAEPVGNGYARIETAASDWAAWAAGEITNAAIIAFAAASGSWGTLSHVVLFDAKTAGNVLGSGALTTPTAITTGQAPRFPIGDLHITGA